MAIRIYVSPSQQSGNVGPNGYNEKRVMHQLSDILVPMLKQYAELEVFASTQSMTLDQAVSDSNEKRADYHIALHSNATGIPQSTTRGCEIYIYEKGGAAEKLAKKVYTHLSALTPTPDRGIIVNQGLYELNSTTAQAILIEVDFHDNVAGADWIMNNLTPIAGTILKGTLEHLGIKYVDPNKPIVEITSVNDIVWELYERKIITDKALWLKKLNDDVNSYWLARNTVQYLRLRNV